MRADVSPNWGAILKLQSDPKPVVGAGGVVVRAATFTTRRRPLAVGTRVPGFEVNQTRCHFLSEIDHVIQIDCKRDLAASQ